VPTQTLTKSIENEMGKFVMRIFHHQFRDTGIGAVRVSEVLRLWMTGQTEAKDTIEPLGILGSRRLKEVEVTHLSHPPGWCSLGITLLQFPVINENPDQLALFGDINLYIVACNLEIVGITPTRPPVVPNIGEVKGRK